jgi:foldase protein PrsA
LEEGEVSDVIELDSSYYVVRLDAKTDEEATEETRQDIISERQSDHYSEVLDAWKEASDWTLNEKVWAKVSFDNLFTTIAESTESADETEAELVETTEQ